MKQEDKELLLKDLCGRLTYGVILSVGVFDNGGMKYHNKKLDCHSNLLSLIELDGGYYFNGLLCKYSQFSARPYLRLMSSMTEEEKKEYDKFVYVDTAEIFDWLNAHHFDYRGLIEKGLALKALKGMYGKEAEK